MIALARCEAALKAMRSKIVGTVHDSILFEVHRSEAAEVMSLVKQLMETPPLRQWFGVTLPIPLVADVSIGTHWGSLTEVDGGMVVSSSLDTWLKEQGYGLV